MILEYFDRFILGKSYVDVCNKVFKINFKLYFLVIFYNNLIESEEKLESFLVKKNDVKRKGLSIN